MQLNNQIIAIWLPKAIEWQSNITCPRICCLIALGSIVESSLEWTQKTHTITNLWRISFTSYLHWPLLLYAYVCDAGHKNCVRFRKSWSWKNTFIWITLQRIKLSNKNLQDCVNCQGMSIEKFDCRINRSRSKLHFFSIFDRLRLASSDFDRLWNAFIKSDH